MPTYSVGGEKDWDYWSRSLDITNPWDDEKNWSLDNSGGLNKYASPEGLASQGYFSKLLSGDRGALGLAGLGLSTVGTMGNLIMLPKQLELAENQNNLLGQQLETNRYKIDKDKRITASLENYRTPTSSAVTSNA